MTRSVTPPDGAVRAFLGQAASGALPETALFGSAEGEEFIVRRRTTRRAVRPLVPVHEVLEQETDTGVPVRVYRPDRPQDAPLVVYFHGGGWSIGDLNMHDATCRLISSRTGAVVVNVGYRLAPEHPFPAPLDDCLGATTWAVGNAQKWGVDARRVLVAGTSAGANLAAAVAVRRRDGADAVPLAGMLLLYPVLDARMATPSYAEKAEGYFLTAAEMRFFWDAYVQDGQDRTSPSLSPGLVAEVAGLPPAVVVTAEHDPLRDEGNAFAARLKAEGLLYAGYEAPGQIHGFITAFPGDATTGHVHDLVNEAVLSLRAE